MLPSPVITRKLLTNGAYGFPNRGDERRVPPIAVLCLHVTANPNDPPATALQERAYANRDGSGGPSAHVYVERDGSAVEAIDFRRFAAWSNGDVRSPRVSVDGIPEILATGRNANEAYAVEIETCGRWTKYPQTGAQIQTVAFLAARAALHFRLPITRSTMHLHSDLNTETRPNCPAPRDQAEAMIGRIIGLANDYLEVLKLRQEVAVRDVAIAGLKADLKLASDEVVDLKADLALVEEKAKAREVEWTGYAAAVAEKAHAIFSEPLP